ncbi:MAG: hypothetical protein LBH69_04670 [Methanomassiliicoccaceae archaeon]|jgi:hypothetical protein|nr:hypothetical protein [Methanomassiliicoccaceae archaeon]
MGGLTIICGHYGTGKTNLAMNLAIDRAREGKSVTLVDMDIVNPYFTSSVYADILRENGVSVISPLFAGTNMEVTAIPASMYSIFDTADEVIIDAGGDDAGAMILGRFSGEIKKKGYEMICVTNMYRPMTADPNDAAEMIRGIEAVCRLKATGIVNNSHLKDLTAVSTVTDSLPYAKAVSEAAGIPLLFTTVPRGLINGMPADEYFYPVDVYVLVTWEKGARICRQ